MIVNSIIGGREFFGEDKLTLEGDLTLSLINDEARIPIEHIYKHVPSKSFFDGIYNQFVSSKKSYVTALSSICNISIKQSSQKFDSAANFLKNAYEFYYNSSRSSSHYIIPKGNVVISISSTDPLEGMLNALIPALFAGNNCFVKPSRKNFLINYMFFRDMQHIPEFSHRCHLLFTTNECFSRSVSSGAYDFIYWSGSYASSLSIKGLTANTPTEFHFEGSGFDILHLDSMYSKELFERIIINSFTDLNGKNCNRVRIISFPSQLSTQVQAQLQQISSELLDSKGLSIAFSQVENSDDLFNESGNVDLTLIETSSFQELKQLIDESDYGLGLTILTDRVEDALSNKFAVSRLNINSDPLCVDYFDSWGGIKKSGSSGSKHWLDKFSYRCHVVMGGRS